MRVKAKVMGFYKGSRRRPGEVFDLAPGDSLAPWMGLAQGEDLVEVEDPQPVPRRGRKAPPPRSFTEVMTDPDPLSE